jgi:hypothetical protein
MTNADSHDSDQIVRIGRSLRSFPPSTPDMRLSPHPAFQYSDKHSYVSLRVSRWIRVLTPQSAPVRAQHNPLHGVPRCAGEQGSTTPTVICFLWFVHFFSLQVPFPGEPSPCPAHYRLAFDYYVAAALSPACWHSCIPFG